jgi:hypothetical protein
MDAMKQTQQLFKSHAYQFTADNPFAADVELPSSYKDATSGMYADQWKGAIQNEVASLEKHGVFKCVKRKGLPSNANIISGRWVFKVKPNPDGSISKFKCRLVARGFLQKFGVDFTDTFSPVARSASIKLLLSIAQKMSLQLRSADVSTAFLFGDLPETERIYMEVPPGISAEPGEVLALYRCVYGLRQASRRWYERLRQALLKSGYHPLKADPCVYHRFVDGEYTVIATIVDDLLIASTTVEGCKRVSRVMNTDGLDTKDLGTPDYIIGMHIKRTATNITLNQSLYIKTLLKRFNMEGCYPSSTPANPTVKLTKRLEALTAAEKDLMAHRPYRALVGGLLYLVLTRPDIAVAVNQLCRYLVNPGPTMWTAAKRVLRYLKGTIHYSIAFSSDNKQFGNNLTCWVDSSHADDLDSRRSRCGFLIYFDNSPISWKTTLQSRVALSTAEAEYRAATLATKEVVWIRRLLAELGFTQTSPTHLYEDNSACIKMVENPIVSERNKHMELDCHFVRDHHHLEAIKMVPIPTRLQKADLFTKNLGRVSFESFVFDLMNRTQ